MPLLIFNAFTYNAFTFNAFTYKAFTYNAFTYNDFNYNIKTNLTLHICFYLLLWAKLFISKLSNKLCHYK
jgi:hypothetical protein